MSAGSLASPLAPPLGRRLRPALPALLLGLLAWGLLFRAEIAAAVRVWIESTAYNHGFLILPLALWLAWDRRAGLRGLAPEPTLWPVLAAVPCGIAWFLADRLGIMEGRQLAAMGLLEVLLVAWLGWRLARALAAPLAYLVFLVPFGAFITPVLQVFTARFVNVGLDVLGIPHVVTDFLIEIPEGRFFVAEACAGLRFLIASIAFGALYALLLYRSPWRRLAFLAASLVVPVIANGLRALGIVALGHVLGSAEAAATDHVVYGWGFFSAVILLLTLAGLPFRQDVMPRPPAAAASPAPPRPATAWGAMVAALLLAAVAPAGAALLDRPQPVPPLALPAFTAGAACIAAPGPAAAPDAAARTQSFDCGGARLVAGVRILPPRSGPAALKAAMLDATGERGLEDVQEDRLAVPGVTPASWRVVNLAQPPRLVAVAAYVHGAPAQGGLAGRFRLAWDGLTGQGGPAIVVSAAIDLPDPPTPPAAEAALTALQDFLHAQADALAAIGRATAPPALR